jgi:dolichol-phosphate mannosyltransferase
MTEGPPPRCSVVMPAYNEEGAIAEAVTDIRTHVLAVVPDAEILVVNDGSKDRTGVVLDTLATQEPRLRVLHKPNGGHGSAVIAGADAARGDWLFFIDSDRQIPLDGFGAAWRAVEAGADAAFGVRRRRHDPRLRLWLTMVIRHALRGLLGVRLYDANVPYKLVRRSTWLDARRFIPDDTLAPSLFLAVFLARRGARITELVVTHRERRTGQVSIRRWKLLRFCARALRQLLRLRRELPA